LSRVEKCGILSRISTLLSELDFLYTYIAPEWKLFGLQATQ
jgi:hypothetical protein